MGHEAEDDRLHGGHVAEPNFWNVEGADNVGPGVGVRPLESSISGGAQLAALQIWDKIND